MSVARLHPLEEILLAIHRAAPRSWHYRVECPRQGYEPAGVERILELLHLEGLIQRGEGPAADGPGVILTPLGEQVVADPAMMDRLRTGQPINSSDAGAIVRQSLRRQVTPTLTRLLVLSNLIVFAWCAYLASQKGLLRAYLAPSLSVGAAVGERILHPAGGLYAVDLLRGQWWRLLSNCFLHGGSLHLLMNMYTLYALGRSVELTWGWWRYGLIYILSGWGGSCLAMALAPTQGVIGASGAICGVFAAEGVWIFLNGKYLPRGMAQRGRRQIITSIVLLVFISLLPSVSGYGHLGGAIVGAVAAVALNFLRLSRTPARWLAVPVLIALPIASYWHMEHARKTSKGWYAVELVVFSQDWVHTLQQTMRSNMEDYDREVKEVRELHAERREAEEVTTAIATLDKDITALDALAADLEKSGPYYDPDVIEARQNAIDYVRQMALVYREARRCLQIGKEWKGADEKAFDEQWQTMLRLRQEWQQRLH